MARDNPENIECQLRLRRNQTLVRRGAWKNEMDSDNMNLNNYGDNFNSHRGLGSEKYQAGLYPLNKPLFVFDRLQVFIAIR